MPKPRVVKYDPAKTKIVTLHRKGNPEALKKDVEVLRFETTYDKLFQHDFKTGASIPPDVQTQLDASSQQYEKDYHQVMENWENFAKKAHGNFGKALNAHGRYQNILRTFEKTCRRELKQIRDAQLKEYDDLIDKEKQKDNPDKELISAYEDRKKQIKSDCKEALAAMEEEFCKKKDKITQRFCINQDDIENGKVKEQVTGPSFMRSSTTGRALIGDPAGTMQKKGGVDITIGTGRTHITKWPGQKTMKVHMEANEHGKVKMSMTIPKNMDKRQTKTLARRYMKMNATTLKKDRPFYFKSNNADLNFEIYKEARKQGWAREDLKEIGFKADKAGSKAADKLQQRIDEWEEKKGLQKGGRYQKIESKAEAEREVDEVTGKKFASYDTDVQLRSRSVYKEQVEKAEEATQTEGKKVDVSVDPETPETPGLS